VKIWLALEMLKKWDEQINHEDRTEICIEGINNLKIEIDNLKKTIAECIK
jgi:hypothetical protein